LDFKIGPCTGRVSLYWQIKLVLRIKPPTGNALATRGA